MKGKIKKKLKITLDKKMQTTRHQKQSQTKQNQTKQKRKEPQIFHFNVSYCKVIFGAFLLW